MLHPWKEDLPLPSSMRIDLSKDYTHHLPSPERLQISQNNSWLSRMSCPNWQWHRTGSCWSSVRTLPVAPLWCDLGFVPNSRGNKAAANLRPMLCLSWNLLPDWSLTNRLSPEKELFELWLQNSTSSMLQRASKRADIFALWPKLCKLWSKEVMLSKWPWLS